MEENKQFMKEWEEEGIQNWKTNQTTRKKAIERVLYFENR